jgi:C-terminal processing protease CtpA/Prc
MRDRLLISALVSLAVAACGDTPAPAEPEYALGPEAEAYLNYALDLMQNHSIKRLDIEWPAFRRQTLEEGGEAQTPAETYDAIRSALTRLGDNHSDFLPPPSEGASASGGSGPPERVEPSARSIVPGIGYLEVPPFSGGGSAGDDHATAYHRVIEDVDTSNATCRWIVDLRGNTGGNMWPMLAGVGPILGEGIVGYFIDPDRVVLSWLYRAGDARLTEAILASAEDPYTLRESIVHVAVLTDSLTASAAEAVAIAFKGRPNTRSFGQATFGVSTANSAFRLSDGALLILTISTMVDRDGIRYGQEVLPDELMTGTKTGDPDTDAVLRAAFEWAGDQVCR